MKQVIVIKLKPSPQQHKALLATLEAFNLACQYAADVSYQKNIRNSIALQPLVYGELRSQFGLSSQMAIRAIAKAVESCRRSPHTRVEIAPLGAMVYDPRIMTFKGEAHVLLRCIDKRELIPMSYGTYQKERLCYAKGQADLMLRGGTFSLYVTIDVPTLPKQISADVLGVDLGIVNLAMDSDGEKHTGKGIKASRRRYRRLRTGLQKAATKNAKKHLVRVRRREARYQRHISHCISKHLVRKALVGQKALALEELTGIRERMQATVQKTQRYERLSWSFRQLREFIAYKATANGVSLLLIDPRDTSRTCLACGHCAKENRRSQSEFLCIECGFRADADFVGASNIRRKGLEARAVLSTPMDAFASGA